MGQRLLGRAGEAAHQGAPHGQAQGPRRLPLRQTPGLVAKTVVQIQTRQQLTPQPLGGRLQIARCWRPRRMPPPAARVVPVDLGAGPREADQIPVHLQPPGFRSQGLADAAQAPAQRAARVVGPLPQQMHSAPRRSGRPLASRYPSSARVFRDRSRPNGAPPRESSRPPSKRTSREPSLRAGASCRRLATCWFLPRGLTRSHTPAGQLCLLTGAGASAAATKKGRPVMSTTTFDPVKYKETTRQQWQEAAEAWHRWSPAIEGWLGGHPPHARPGRRGPRRSRARRRRGAGSQALTIAERVGPKGHVLATDISPRILELRRRREALRAICPGSGPGCSTARTWTCPEASFDVRSLPGGAHLLPRPGPGPRGMVGRCGPAGASRPSCIPRPTRTASSRCRWRSSAGGRTWARPCPASRAPSAWAPRASSSRPTGRPALARRRGRGGPLAGAPVLRGRVPALRAGVLRRPSPDALGAQRARPASGLAGGRRGLARLRGSRRRRLRGALRDACGCGHQ